MNEVYISKQKIVNNKNKVYAYELIFKDDMNKRTGFSSNVKRTSQLIMSSITSSELDKLL